MYGALEAPSGAVCAPLPLPAQEDPQTRTNRLSPEQEGVLQALSPAGYDHGRKLRRGAVPPLTESASPSAGTRSRRLDYGSVASYGCRSD
eukprot:817346-Prorocentrum_minimum.AAC.2